MRAGRLAQTGKAEGLYRHPMDLFVARLFCEINEIPLRVAGGALRTPIGVFAVPGLGEGDPVHSASRHPLGRSPPGSARTRLHVRLLGDQAALEIAAQGFEPPLLTLVREWEVPQRRQEVSISVDPESVLVFLPKSLQRMTEN